MASSERGPVDHANPDDPRNQDLEPGTHVIGRADRADHDLRPGQTIQFDMKGRRGSKAAVIAAIAATPFGVKGAVDTLGPVAEGLGERIAHILPEGDGVEGGPTIDQVRESVERTRARAEAPSPTDAQK